MSTKQQVASPLSSRDHLRIPTRPDLDPGSEDNQLGPNAKFERTSQPPGQLEGFHDFGPLRTWLSFLDDQFVDKKTGRTFDEFTAVLIESRLVRVFMEDGGTVFCGSSNREVADTGRPGKVCETCEDQGEGCFLHWHIAWYDLQSEQVYAHTMSRTSTLNFQRYANDLVQGELLPNQVITRIHIEEAQRIRSGEPYTRIQFERMDVVEPVTALD